MTAGRAVVPEQRRRLIHVLSVIVALDIVVAVVGVYTRGDGLTGRPDGERVAAGKVDTPRPLAAGNFTKRRVGIPSTSTTTQAPTTTTTAAPPTTTTIAAPVPAAANTRSPGSRRSTRRSTSITTRRSATVAAAAKGERDPGTLADPVGDTFVAESNAPLTENRADIVHARAAYEAQALTFAMQVRQPTDPRQDDRWAGNSTYAMWAVDTTGDAVADYEVHYFLADQENVGGYVSRPGQEDPLCGVSSATYGADGYKVTVDPTCLGTPASFTYRATMSYDTNPIDQTAAVANDVAPNKGMSPAIRSSG